MNPADRCRVHAPAATAFAAALCASLALLAGCGKDDKKDAARPPVEVTALAVVARDVPVSSVYVAQTQSSQAVNIPARVSGFLDKRVYTEGAVVKAGQVLFRMDQKPFQAQVDAAAAALQRNQAALDVAQANLARTKPLAQQNALSQKDLDDAQGQYEQSAAAVAQSKAQLESAKLDLSYTTITSPVDGVSSFAAVADGTYVNAAEQPADDGFGADADVDQFQHLRERDGAHPQPGAEGPAQTARRQSVRRRDRARRRHPVSLQGQDHLRRSVVQLADRNLPDPRVGRQSRGACCGRTSTCARGCRARSVRTRSSCRSARCSRARRATSSGSSTRNRRPSCGRSSSATGTATAGSSRRASPPATASSSTARCGSRRTRRSR